MKNIFLTSCGIINDAIKTEFYNIITKDVKDIKVLYITTASDGEADSDKTWMEEEFRTILDLGVLKENITEHKIGNEININEFDVMYMMGGFNFSTEDKILRYIFRGDTIYDVIIPKDAEVINVDEEKGIYRANKIIVTNPRKITEDMVINIYKKSTLPINRYFQCIYCLLFRKYINASKYIINDIVNKNNIDEAIKEFEEFSSRSNNNTIGIFDYDKLFPEAKEIYNILLEIKKRQ